MFPLFTAAALCVLAALAVPALFSLVGAVRGDRS